MKWLIAIAVVLTGTAVFAIWWNFSDPKFVASMIALAISAAMNVILPVLLKRKTDYKAENQAYREGRGWDHLKNRPRDSK